VTGEKKQTQTQQNYRLAERRYGRFSRSFRLPATVDTNGVQASCEHGVLTIRLPRAEAAKPRRIQVTAGDPGPAAP
jgi:HSP20 family protein